MWWTQLIISSIIMMMSYYYYAITIVSKNLSAITTRNDQARLS